MVAQNTCCDTGPDAPCRRWTDACRVADNTIMILPWQVYTAMWENWKHTRVVQEHDKDSGVYWYAKVNGD